MASSRAGWGCESLMTAVRSSGVSTLSTGAIMVLNGWFAFTVMMEKATSLEVMGWPSWKVAPSTSFRVTVRPSPEMSHSRARYGCGFQFSSNRRGVAKSCEPG